MACDALACTECAVFVCDPISTPLPCLCVATMQIEDISSITFTRELYYHLLRGKDVLNVRFHELSAAA
jgi:hypothetical protein